MTSTRGRSDAARDDKKGLNNKTWLSFPGDRNVLISPYASLTVVMDINIGTGRCGKNTNGVNERGECFVWRCPECIVSMRCMTSRTNNHIKSQAVGEMFLDVHNLPRPH